MSFLVKPARRSPLPRRVNDQNGRSRPAYSAMLPATHWAKRSTFSGVHLPSQGIVPACSTLRMAWAFARTSSKDHRSNLRSIEPRSFSRKRGLMSLENVGSATRSPIQTIGPEPSHSLLSSPPRRYSQENIGGGPPLQKPLIMSHVIATRFTELLGCRVPLQQAGMGGLATPEMAAAVAEAGGLGMVGWVISPPESVAVQLDGLAPDVRSHIGMNFIVPFLGSDATDVVAAAASRVRLAEFFYEMPDPKLVDAAHAQGALVCWQVGTPEEARCAVDAGCDLVVAQGVDAGGHIRGTTPLLPLLDSVLTVVDVPVIAAGGIGTGRAMAAALAAGADGVRVGTRFVGSLEADVHPDYQAALGAAGPEDTVYTEAFSGLWAAPHRVLRSAVDAANELTDEVIGEAELGGARVPVNRFSAMYPTRTSTGHVEAMALYAGTSVGAVGRPLPAADIVHELASEAEQILRERCSSLLRPG